MGFVRKRKILMIDDSPVILEAGRMALEDAGYDVVTADNPLIVASLVRKERPDLVLIDVNMPAVTGDVVAQIAAQYGLTGNEKTRVVLYSDISTAELYERARRCGAAGYIRKTGDEAAMISEVERFLSQGAGPPAL
jgi:DNA-binding NarL/FixJ family response regulator